MVNLNSQFPHIISPYEENRKIQNKSRIAKLWHSLVNCACISKIIKFAKKIFCCVKPISKKNLKDIKVKTTSAVRKEIPLPNPNAQQSTSLPKVQQKIEEQTALAKEKTTIQEPIYDDFQAMLKGQDLKKDWDPIKEDWDSTNVPVAAPAVPMPESEKKTSELLDKEIADIHSLMRDEMMAPPSRGRNRYILTKNVNDYEICYKDETGKMITKLIKTDANGQIIFDGKEYRSFEDLKKNLNLWKHYTEKEIGSTLHIQSLIRKGYGTSREEIAIQDALRRKGVAGSYMICQSNDEDSFIIYYRKGLGIIENHQI